MGHPVDVSSGAVSSTHLDVHLLGKVDVTWRRHYSTARLDSQATPLGRGWTGPYFAALDLDGPEYHVSLPDGGFQVFTDVAGAVERGGVARDPGAFMELEKRDQSYVVTHWDPDTNGVARYVFRALGVGTSWPLASVEDVTGQAVDLHYDYDGRLLGVHQRLERRGLAIDYDAGGHIKAVAAVTDGVRRGELVRYTHDAAGRLTTVTDASGHSEYYEYDEAARLTRATAKDGGVVEFKYDATGRCVRTSGLGAYDRKTLRFSDAIGSTTVTDSLGHVALYRWLPSGQVVSHVDALGAEQRTAYDEAGRVVAVTDANGGTTRYEYDDRGNRSRIVNPLGAETVVTFNDAHQPLSVTDPAGNVWLRRYDAFNRLRAAVDPLGSAWTYAYEASGNLVEIRDPAGAVKRLRYSSTGDVVEETDWNGDSKRYVVDDYGRVVERTDAGGGVTRFTYDIMGYPVETRFPDGGSVRCAYDAAGNLVRYTDANGNVTRSRYAPNRRLVEHVDPLGNTTRYVWGSEPGLLEEVVNARGERYRLTYDAASRLVGETGFDGRELTFEYDPAGNHIATAIGERERVVYQRDALGRIEAKTLPDGSRISFEYDAVGSLVAAATPACAVHFVRDAAGRVVSEQQGDVVLERRYDRAGRRATLRSSIGHVLDCAHDGNGRVLRYTLDGQHTIQRQLDRAGLEVARWLPGNVRLDQRFDVGRHVVQQVVWRATGRGAAVAPAGAPREGTAGAPIVHRTYRYDPAGWLHETTDDRWGTVAYGYDPAERLVEGRAVAATGERQERFAYDATGNVTRIERNGVPTRLEYLPGDRLRQRGEIQYLHDGNGRVVRKIEPSQGEGAPRAWVFTWNALDQLTSVRTPGGAVWSYVYDAFGRRVGKHGPDGAVKYVWDDDVLLHEAAASHPLRTWVVDSGSFRPISMLQGGVPYAVITDHLGTPRELVDPRGEVAWSGAHDAWGGPVAGHGGRVDCDLRFPGQYHDSESGLHYNRFRYYDPSSGRYISADPIRLAGGVNVRAYARNPVNWTDPFGLMAEGECLKTKAEKARDARVKELKEAGETPGAVVGAYDPKTGKVAVGVSGPAPSADHVDPALVAKADALGGLGAKTDLAKGRVGSCAEFDAANQLVKGGSKVEDIQFTDAVQPRKETVVPMCGHCKAMFGENGGGG